MKALVLSGVLSLAIPMVANAQANPLSSHAKGLHDGLRMLVVESAQRMPEQEFGFRPTAGVRTYAQILGHLADIEYQYCSTILDEKDPAPQVEMKLSSKAELIAALHTAYSYCDRAFSAVTDGTGAETVTFMGAPVPKLALLSVSHMHTALHYGNLVTYMRMKGVLPPTSDPTIMPHLRK